METIYKCCAGLDVHKKTVACCVRRMGADGTLDTKTREFGTMTADLMELVASLKAQGVTHVAMESTGVFWKPIYNMLEAHFTVALVNAQHVKTVPGRKTDQTDCPWLAQLLQFGLLKPSFIPPRWQRDLRDLTRERTQLTQEESRVANRIHKVLEDANIKLGSVASDILGVSGRDMIAALIAGEQDPAAVAELARRKLRGKIPEFKRALHGAMREHHRFQLQLLSDQLAALEGLIQRLDRRIAEWTEAYGEPMKRLDEIVGIDRRVAEVVVAEVGVDLSPFPSDVHLTSWAGICPGNDESAGKRRTGKTRKGSRWLRQALVQAAWAASHSKNTYLAARYRRLVGRRGKKRALVAVAHSLLKMIYHLLQNGTAYRDLGGNYFDRLNPERLTRYLVKRLESLGHKVTLEPLASAS